MTDVAQPPHRDSGLERLLFFSDGVFAIAITLLSIELHPPHDWNGTAADLWSRGWPGFAAYGLSFLVIGVFWNTHRRIFTLISRFTQGVFFWNLLLLGVIALMPFMTSLLYREGSTGEAFFIYMAAVAAGGLAQGALLAWATFVDRAVHAGMPLSRQVMGMVSAGLLPGLFSAGSILLFASFAGSEVPIWLPLTLLGLGSVILAARGWADRRHG